MGICDGMGCDVMRCGDSVSEQAKSFSLQSTGSSLMILRLKNAAMNDARGVKSVLHCGKSCSSILRDTSQQDYHL